MNRKEQIRLQLEQGLPSEWISEEVVEAVAFALGNRFMKAAPELAEPRHVVAITKYARRIEESGK